MKSYKKYFLQYQSIITSIVIVIFVIFGGLFGTYPTVGSILTMRANSSKTEKYIKILREKNALLESIDEGEYKQYLSELALAVPTDKSLTSLFSTIDGLSSEAGITLSDFTLVKPGSIATESAGRRSNEEKKVGSSFLSFTLTVTGTYEQIHYFIKKSISVRRFFRIRFFSISFTPSGIISVNMAMDAYYAPLPSIIASTVQAIEPLTESDFETIKKVMAMPVLGTDFKPSESATGNVETTKREDPFSL